MEKSDNFVKLPNDVIMQLYYCPPFIPHIVRTFLSVPSPPVHVFPSNTSLSSGTYLHMFPHYLMYVSLFNYNSSYRARFLKGWLEQIQD